SGAEASCPYLYAWSDRENAWTSYGKVLHVAEGRQRESIEQVKLKELATRFRLAEEEPENAFIDHIQLRLETTDGTIFALTPDVPELSRRDNNYANIPAYKSIEFTFILPDWLDRASVRQSTLILTGYYERIPARVCMTR